MIEKLSNLNLPEEISAIALVELIEEHSIPYVVYSSGPYFTSRDLSKAKTRGKNPFDFTHHFALPYTIRYGGRLKDYDVWYLSSQESDEFLTMYPGEESPEHTIELVGWRTALLYLQSNKKELELRPLFAKPDVTETEKDSLIKQIWTNLHMAQHYLNEFVDRNDMNLEETEYHRGVGWLNIIYYLIDRRYKHTPYKLPKE